MRSRPCADDEQRPGDAWILNDPYRGGTHLPDITLVSPLFVGEHARRLRRQPRAPRRRRRRRSRAACRPRSTTLAEEGVVIPPTRIAVDGRPRRGAASRPHVPDARRRGSARPTCARSWRPTGSPAPRLARARRTPRARRCVRDGNGGGARLRGAAHAGLASRGSPTARYRARDVLEDDGGADRATSRSRSRCVGGDELEVDFAGTDPQSDGNLNCPLSVTKSAVYYVLRVADRPRHPRLGGRLPPGRRDRPAGLPRQRAPAGRGRGRQRRDLEPHRGRRDARARRGARRCRRWARAR